MSAWRTGKERDAETGRASKRKVNPSNRNPLKYRCCTVTISFETQAITAWPELAQGCSMLTTKHSCPGGTLGPSSNLIRGYGGPRRRICSIATAVPI